VLSPRGVRLRRVLFNKRLTGYLNLLMKRGRAYREELLTAVLADATARADHLVVSGDVTNLALRGELAAAQALLEEAARRVEVTVVPGNHDVYLPAVHRERRFTRYLERFLDGDLPELAVELTAGRFPVVKLRGPAAIIALSTAVPRPPFVSSGVLGAAQLDALARVLAHREVAARLPVIVLHHPPIDPWLPLERWRGGLIDAAALRAVLAPLRRGLVLYGHLHERRWQRLGEVDVVGATAAALDHPDRRRRAGWNLYEIGDDAALAGARARVVDAAGAGLRDEALG
jgi:3',5'-cyclic AMP phosphodiesterase CpdA